MLQKELLRFALICYVSRLCFYVLRTVTIGGPTTGTLVFFFKQLGAHVVYVNHTSPWIESIPSNFHFS